MRHSLSITKVNLQAKVVYPLTVPSCALLLRSGPSLRTSSASTSVPSSTSASSSYSSSGVGQQDAIRNICRTTRNSASFRSRLSNSDMTDRWARRSSGYWRLWRKWDRSLENLLAKQESAGHQVTFDVKVNLFGANEWYVSITPSHADLYCTTWVGFTVTSFSNNRKLFQTYCLSIIELTENISRNIILITDLI